MWNLNSRPGIQINTQKKIFKITALKFLQHPVSDPYLKKHIKDGPEEIPFFVLSGMPEQLKVQLTGSRSDVISRKEGAGRLLWQHKSVQMVLAYRPLPLN